jgi:hypothetical protein
MFLDGYHPLFIPHIPISQHSIIPCAPGKHYPDRIKPKPGLLSMDFLKNFDNAKFFGDRCR